MPAALLTISVTGPPSTLGEYLLDVDDATLDAFAREVRSHGFIYRAEWRRVGSSGLPPGHPALIRGVTSLDVIRRELDWLFED